MRLFRWDGRQILSMLCLCSFVTCAQAQLSATELERLFANDGKHGDAMGWAVDVDGNRAVVGAPHDDADGVGANAGAAYVYLRNAQTGDWEQEDKLVMPDMSAGDQFGASVAISGNVIVVGAPLDNINVGSNLHGSAHVFTYIAGNWNSGVELTTGTPDVIANRWGDFGISVAIDGDTIVVGVAFDNEQGDSSGSAFVFERSGQNWSMAKKLLPPQGDDQNFGWSVAIDKTTILIGAPHWTASGIGEAYIFEHAMGSWPNSGAKMLPTDNLGDDNFGYSVDIYGDLAVVGARYDDDAVLGEKAGSISIFRQSAGQWSLQEKLTSSNGEASDYFGFDVATNGEVVVAGATQNGNFNRGSVYLFTTPASSWLEDQIVFPERNPFDVSTVTQFGSSVALDYGTLIAGARTSDVYDGSAYQYGAGAAFVYGLNATSITSTVGIGQQVGIQAPVGTYLSNVSVFRPESLGTLPPATTFPLGAVGFTVNGLNPGEAIEVELTYSDSLALSGFYKFSDHWYEFMDDGTSGAVISPGVVRLKLIDGGRGDHDGLANGVIVDPGGPVLVQIEELVFKNSFE